MPAVFVLTMVCVASTAISAHRLDEYLQATRVALELDGVAIDVDLTPGVAVSESIINLVDVNGDGSLSPDEQRAYAGQVVDDLKISLNGTPVSLQLDSMEFPDLSAFRRGDGTIRLRARAAHGTLSTGSHQIHLRNAHRSADGVYLANALIPDDRRISVTGQDRDGDQRELTINYSVDKSPAALPLALILLGAVACVALARTIHH